MKNLTHYFTSPKEEETTIKSSSILLEHCDSSEKTIQNCIIKKRKINLSKRKSKKDEILVDQSESELKIENGHNKLDNTIKNPKKRKITEEKISEEITANSKKVKLTISKSSKLKLVKRNSISNNGDTSEKLDAQINCKKSSEVIIAIESNSNSSDEPLTKIKRNKFDKNPFLESDDDNDNLTPSLILETSDISKNGTENSSITVKNANCSRNSLLGYFNKIDKETALKEKKPEVIKVEAQVHSPPDEKVKPPRSSLSKRLKKSKHHKTKQANDYDVIEVISSEDISNDVKLQTLEPSPKIEYEEVMVTDIKEEINVVKPKLTNIASIFLCKKFEKKLSETNNSVNSEELQLLEEEKLKTEEVKDTQIKHKKSLTIKSSSKNNEHKLKKNNKTKINSINVSPDELNLNSSKQTTQYRTETINKIKLKKRINNGSSIMTSSNHLEDKENLSQTQEPDETEKASAAVVQAFESKTPEEQKGYDTQKRKSLKIDGYFTPKVSGDSSEKKESVEKVDKNKTLPSPWIMKVRLSASKSAIGSDNDYESKDSFHEEQQEGESDVKTKCNDVSVPKDDIVVVDEEDGSSSQKNYARRKKLSRSAKALKYTEDKDEPIKLPTVITIDEEDGSNSSQENNEKKTCLLKTKCAEKEPESTKQPVKIWPFFQKGGTRQAKDPSVDQEKLKAKQLFLESGVPEVLKKKVDIEKSDILGVPAPFPTVAHVTQTDEISTTTETSTPFFLPRQHCLSASPAVPVWSSLLSTDDSDEPEIPVFQRPGNVKAHLEKMKNEEPKTEVKALYKCLKEYKNKSESDIWTEVYKPNKSADIVGNSENIKKLKTWLETFKDRRRREGSGSSGDEFMNEDSDGGSSAINNLAVVSGPSGCGKTCAIYAIAAELDCKVLEINASCNRAGKRILSELSESTQSHQVERSQKINEMTNDQRREKSKKRKKKLKKTSETKSEMTSLILVEDADLLFTDADEGFMQALSSLAATAKRPIILVTNQTRNPHLDRFESNRPLHLTFSKPKASKLELWLRLIGLVEGVQVAAEQAKCLVAWSGCDVRRALLQLQLMVHSNNSELKEKQTQSKLWWQWPLHRGLKFELPTLLEAEELPQPPQVDKVQLLRELEDISHTTSRLAYLDSFSTRCSYQLQTLSDLEDPCPTSWTVKCSDSTAQTQCLLDPVHSTGPQLADWLAETVAREGSTDTDRPGGPTAHEARWLSIFQQSEQMFLSGVSSSMLTNHGAVACDYLPSLREMGRAEQTRLTNYSRRANRFFNYLQGLGIHASKSYRDFMCDAFS